MTSPLAPSADDIKGSNGPNFLLPPRAIAYTELGGIPTPLTEPFVQKVFGTLGLTGVVKVNCGWAIVQWAGGSATSKSNTILHGLGQAPFIAATHWSGATDAGVLNYTPVFRLSSIDSTSFVVNAQTIDAQLPLNFTTTSFMWVAIAPQGPFSGSLP